MDKFISSCPRGKRTYEDDFDADDPILGHPGPSQLETPRSTTNKTTIIDGTQNYLLDGKYYKIVSVNESKMVVSCQQCSKQIIAHSNSTGNLLSHYKRVHFGMMNKLKLYKTERSSSSNSMSTSKQTKICHSTDNSGFSKKCSRQKVTDLVFNYIVEEMKPISTCEKPSFKKLITGLTNDNFVPDRRIINKELVNKYNCYVDDLIEKVSKQKYICLTTDIWSSLNKSYLGMTMHYIDENTYQRFSYAIACRRIEGSHNYMNIAKCISEILTSYRIDVTKISHTVTDNATNFGKAFRIYAQQFTAESTTNSYLTLNDQSINRLIDDIDQNAESNSELDSEFMENEPDDTEVVNLSDILLNYEDSGNIDNEDVDIVLSNHMTCSAHTLNLVATTDTSKITDLIYKKISRSAFVTRWNSFFDSIKKIIHCRLKVIECFEQLKLSKLKVAEWNFLVEYIKVMEPLTIALDKLQGEKSCYLGYVAPTVITIRHIILMEQNHLVYCASLSKAIIKGLEKRYSFIFDLKEPKSKPYILTAVSHPKFKMDWMPQQFSEICKQLFISECNQIVSEINSETGNYAVSENDSEDDFYSSLLSSSQSSGSFDSSSQRSDNMASLQGLSFLNSKKKDGRKDLTTLDNYPIVKQIFLKYNTTLPSSAPVERLFSSGSQILAPRRNRLGDKTFEMLVCVKPNKIND
ncbi:uncharacterized protein LOC112599519 [Melanaphis sacchari]|uniref:uncharacterized protein LOC112599519 n=1 Tax=Melanaphis sacchari TaxID=742174 RepID=UPI000DC12D87|nr:uncharacterized protein LOC112599519 [Melanaphis sacchari]